MVGRRSTGRRGRALVGLGIGWALVAAACGASGPGTTEGDATTRAETTTTTITDAVDDSNRADGDGDSDIVTVRPPDPSTPTAAAQSPSGPDANGAGNDRTSGLDNTRPGNATSDDNAGDDRATSENNATSDDNAGDDRATSENRATSDDNARSDDPTDDDADPAGGRSPNPAGDDSGATNAVWPVTSQNDGAAAAAASIGPPRPPPTVVPTTGDACPVVVFDGERLIGQTGRRAALAEVDLALEPGRYQLELWSRDFLHRDGTMATQRDERWLVELLDDDGDVVATSDATTDLADDDTLGSTVVEVAIDRPTSTLRARHASVGDRPNSVRPLAIAVRSPTCDVEVDVIELDTERKLLGRTGSARNATGIIDVGERRGLWTIALESVDDHHLQASAPTQPDEIWRLEGVGADGSVVFQTAPTNDLPDDDLATVSVVGTFDLTGVTGLRAVHARPGDSVNSIYPLAALLISTDPDDDPIGWNPAEIRLAAGPGEYDEQAVRLRLEDAIDGPPTIEVSESLADLVVAETGELAADEDGLRIATSIGVSLPSDYERPSEPASADCTVEGTVRLVVAEGGSVGPDLPVCLTVIEEDGGFRPGFRAPSPDRLAEDDDAGTYITGELTVGLEFDLPDPETSIAAVAAASGGQVVGGLPEVSTYQLRFQTETLAELEELADTIADRPDVAFASRRFLAEAETAIPNDPEWDADWADWDGTGCEADGGCDAGTGGNNWYLEAMGMPEAWDIETGSSAVRVGVIDSGFYDGEHEDLAPNVVSVQGRQRSDDAHGERMASSICAQGDNDLGISGMAWDCSLYLYGNRQNRFGPLPDRSSPEAALAQMIAAVDDDVRIVSMSIAYVDNNECVDSFDTGAALRRANEVNDVLARGVEYARRQGKDVLWVIAAGNSCRDVRFGAPSGLALRFPLDVMVVAAVNQNLEPQRVTNFGAGVSVAAPGEDITQAASRFEGLPIIGRLRRVSDYREGRDGTSSATALVSGLAALVLSNNPGFSGAKIKQCIVAAAETDGVEVVGTGATRVPAGPLGFNTVSAPAAVRCSGGLDLPPEVDLVFAVDTSGSMGAELDRLKDEIVDVADGLAAASPGTDFEYALISFEDYVGVFDSSRCGPGNAPRNAWSEYGPARYGNPGDSPFRVELSLNSSRSVLDSRVNGLDLGFGGDVPESYARVLWELGQDDTRGRLGFRADAATVVIMMGDAVPHSANLNQARGPIGEEVDPPFFDRIQADTGLDPGRNGVIDCSFTAGEDPDIYFQGAAIDALEDNEIRLLYLDSSGGLNAEFWQYWAAQVGGAAAAIGTDGRVPGDLDLTTLVIGLLQES